MVDAIRARSGGDAIFFARGMAEDVANGVAKRGGDNSTVGKRGGASDGLSKALLGLFAALRDARQGCATGSSAADCTEAFVHLDLVMRGARLQRSKQQDAVTHLLQATARGLTEHGGQAVSDETKVKFDEVLRLAKDAGVGQTNVGDGSMEDILKALNDLMNAESGNIDQYQKVVEAVMKIVQAISTFMTEIAGHVHSTSDGKGINMDATTLQNDLSNIISKLGGVVCPDTAAWEAELAPFIPSILVSYNGNLCVNTNMDGSMLAALVQSFENVKGGDDNLNPAQYNAWYAGFSGMEQQLEGMGQTIAEKFSHRNSNFDNLIKIISSTVQSMVDTSKQFLQI
ncbi:IpaD/SipD/SspD family type III secretion system needle tip protein (plasmid) [Burkholderia pyrrocinia]|uniref:IpaD/SipD/SspD family type III secretion system needle tip protein n=1 Tax=Burkholderia pyrrocinia TaxID=60550 RepID=UPI0038B56CC7